jgi:hypothetical protein
VDFFRDICRSRDDNYDFYHSVNTLASKSFFLPGHKAHKGVANSKMNKGVLRLCKADPLRLLAFSKSYMQDNNCSEMFLAKAAIIRSVAEDIIRYVTFLSSI